MKATAQDFATCKECLEDFHIEDLIWGDKGSFYYVCEPCYNQEPLCGDHIRPITECGCKP